MKLGFREAELECSGNRSLRPESQQERPVSTMYEILLASAHTEDQLALSEVLAGLGHLTVVSDGWACLSLLQTKPYGALIISDRVDCLDGYDVASFARDIPESRSIPILMVADENDQRAVTSVRDGTVGAVATRPINSARVVSQFMELMSHHLERYWETLEDGPRLALTKGKALHDAVFRNGGAVTPETMTMVRDASSAIADIAANRRIPELLRALKDHDDYTFVHSFKVGAFLSVFAQGLGMRRSDTLRLAQAGLLHDVGKVRTPLPILNKPSRLTDREWTIMRQHPEQSGCLLRMSGCVEDDLVLVGERHHEKLDGTGYPFGLKGGQIDSPSVLTAIADVYSALTDHRPYRSGMAPEKAFVVMANMAGNHLEPGLLRTFIDVMRSEGVVPDIPATSRSAV